MISWYIDKSPPPARLGGVDYVGHRVRVRAKFRNLFGLGLSLTLTLTLTFTDYRPTIEVLSSSSQGGVKARSYIVLVRDRKV